MFDIEGVVGQHPGTVVRSVSRALGSIETAAVDNATRVDLIGDLETLTCAAQAAQAALTADLHAATVAEHARLGVPRARQGRGVAHQVALARRESPHRAESDLGLAIALPHDMPRLYAAWRRGRLTEYRAKLIFSRVVHLDAEDRRGVDTEIAGDAEQVAALVAMGEGEVRGHLDRLAYARDRAGFVKRRAAAEADRHVSSRPAPDTMLRLSALLPVKAGVAAMAALMLAADSARATGDPRSRSQVMADTLVARLTGHHPATSSTPVHLDVTIPLDTLVDHDRETDGAGDAPGWVTGYGPIPPDLARELAADAAQSGTGTWRRLFTDPTTGQLVAMESVARDFPAFLALFLRRRDKYCRTPWCNAPIRHSDHAVPAAEGGPTSAENGQGLCEACNYAKQAPGWRFKTRSDPDGTHVVETTTPTGHTYESRPPPAHPPQRE